MSDLSRPLTDDPKRLLPAHLERLPMPSQERKCYNLPFCLLLAAYWVGMLIVAIYAFHGAGGVNGYKRLTNGAQTDGQICGLDAMAGREYLYWPYPADKPQLTACIASCPTEAGKTLMAHFTNGTTLTFTSYVTKADYHFCLPSDSVAQAATNVAESIASQTYGRLMADLGKAWPALVAASIIAVVLGFLYMTMLFYLGGCLVYSTIVIMLCLMALGGWLLFHRGTIMASGTSASLLKWGGIALWILDAVFLLVCLALRRSISIAVACLKEATVAIGHMKRVLLLPVVKFFNLFLLTIWFVVVAVYLVCSAKVTYSQLAVSNGLSVPYMHVEFNDHLRYAGLYHFFGYLWTIAFFLAIMDIIIAGAVAHWYFTPARNGIKNLESPIAKSIGIALKNQIGAAAFGSLLLAVVWFIQWVMRYVTKKLKDVKDPTGVKRFLICCCNLCMCCFECCVKFISRQAYIQMALFGGGFCESAKHAFELVVRNAGTTAAVTMIGNVFSIMGVCLVMAITGVITFFIVEGTLVKPEGVSSPILPVLIALILAFAISKMFMTVLDMAINTILHCYVADTEAHDGVPVYLSSDSGLHAKLKDHAQRKAARRT